MTCIRRTVALSMFALMAPLLVACQSPTETDESIEVDDLLEVSVTPDPAVAGESTDGKTYRVVRGNNQPDDILAFDWKTQFTITAKMLDAADDDDALEFPVDLTSATVQVQQATGGIVTSPTGGDTEHYDYVAQASSNRFAAVNSSISLTMDVWYDLPSLRKEALITVTLSFKDDDGMTFSKTVTVKVAP